MAIDINNADYKRFTDFAATASKRTTRARLGDTIISDNGTAREIKASSNWDFVGNIGRRAAKREVNDAVRTLFRQTIANMFNGEENIPPNVVDAMKFADYGRGKPLTARRIIAVKTAIDQYIAAEKERLPNATTALRTSAGAVLDEHSHLDASEFNGRVDALVEYVGNDADLMEVLKDQKILKNVLLTLRDGERNLRSEDDLKAKIDALRANLDELRQVANENRALINAGIRSITALHGKAMPQGYITKIVNLAKSANLDDVNKITAKSGMAALHNGLMQYSSAIEKIRLESKAMHVFKGAIYGDELSDMRRFIGNLLLAFCKHSTLRSIQQALTNDACGKLMNAYASVAFDQDFEFPEDVSFALKEEMIVQAKVCLDSVTFMKEIVDDAIGADGKVPMDSQQKNGVDVAFDNPIFDKIIPSVKTAAEISIVNKQGSIIDKYVSGEGQGSGVIRGIMRERIGDIKIANMEEKIQVGFDHIVGSMLNWNMMTTCKIAATQGVKNTDFIKDILRNSGDLTEILIGGEKLSNDTDKALDQIARFVSNDPKATYDGLDAQAKAKVHIVLSFISRKAQTAAYEGTAIALSPNLNKMPFNGIFDEKSEKTKIDISFNDKGGLVVSLKYERPVHAILENGEISAPEDEEHPTDGRTITTGFTYTLTKGSFNKISKLDFSKFDDTQAQQIAQSDTDQKMVKAVKTFNRDYIIPGESGKCNVIFKADLA